MEEREESEDETARAKIPIIGFRFWIIGGED
jgi:hypothetical protein